MDKLIERISVIKNYLDWVKCLQCKKAMNMIVDLEERKNETDKNMPPRIQCQEQVIIILETIWTSITTKFSIIQTWISKIHMPIPKNVSPKLGKICCFFFPAPRKKKKQIRPKSSEWVRVNFFGKKKKYGTFGIRYQKNCLKSKTLLLKENLTTLITTIGAPF